jgi:hypothetical protein
MHGTWSDLDKYDTSVYLEYKWVMTVLNLSLNVVGCIKDSTRLQKETSMRVKPVGQELYST